jgi:hypothetical protein
MQLSERYAQKALATSLCVEALRRDDAIALRTKSHRQTYARAFEINILRSINDIYAEHR